MFLQIPARYLQRFSQGLTHRVVEPGLDAEVEERDREAGHDDGGRDGDAAEQEHQPHMQPRSGGPAPALYPHPCQTAGQDRTQQQQDGQVGQHQAHANAGPPPQGGAAGEDDEGRQADHQCHRGQGQGHALAKHDVAQPAGE
ncbi:hypothetical protein GALL_537840 [mine drainage metagenome]|uniref:Uncharacterized protein n=1 Tax=mine drainage metagenome TaxID=410659 RepID=A0A1J5P220_9ZZZZ